MEVESRLYSRVSVDDTPAASHLMRWALLLIV
jgi:hypothetical protein